MRNRCILHSDANCFYASVEMLLNPELRGKAVAVCGVRKSGTALCWPRVNWPRKRA